MKGNICSLLRTDRIKGGMKKRYYIYVYKDTGFIDIFMSDARKSWINNHSYKIGFF